MLRNMVSLYIRSQNRLLMLYRVGSRVVPPSWCGIGGHFEADELNDPYKCVLRELREETGLAPEDIRGLRLRYITLRLKNGEVRQNYYFFADLNRRMIDVPQCGEGVLEWVDIGDVPAMEMPCTAAHCLKHYLATGQRDDKLYAGAATPNGLDFVELAEF